jgi:hypothetical protein
MSDLLDITARWLRWPLRGRWYRTLKLDWNDREIEITWSSTGRSVHVYVDGVQWGPL